MVSHVLSRSLTVALVASVVLLGWVVVGRGSFGLGGDGKVEPTSLDVFPGVTPTPDLLGGRGDAVAALRQLNLVSPAVGRVARAWLDGDVTRAVDAIQNTTVDCAGVITRGVDLCSTTGRSRGTLVQLFEPNRSLPGYRIERPAAEDTVKYLVQGRNPRPVLVARADSGEYLIVIGLTPKPSLRFPGAIPNGGADVVAVYLTITASGTVVEMNERGSGSPPLEPIRNDIRKGVTEYTILGVGDEFRAWDRAIHDEIEAHRKDPAGTPVSNPNAGP